MLWFAEIWLRKETECNKCKKWPTTFVNSRECFNKGSLQNQKMPQKSKRGAVLKTKSPQLKMQTILRLCKGDPYGLDFDDIWMRYWQHLLYIRLIYELNSSNASDRYD